MTGNKKGPPSNSDDQEKNDADILAGKNMASCDEVEKKIICRF